MAATVAAGSPAEGSVAGVESGGNGAPAGPLAARPTGAYVVIANPQSRDINFSIAKDWSGPAPEDQRKLYVAVESALTVLKQLFPSADPRFDDYFRRLTKLGQGGASGVSADPATALESLAALKREVLTRESGAVKNRYMRQLGKASAVSAAAFLILGSVLKLLPELSNLANTQPIGQLTTLANYAFLLAGCMGGVWLSFGARKTELTFEELAVPESDRLDPLVRLAFAGLCTLVVGLLFGLSAVTVTVGSVSTTQLISNSGIALLVGVLCGFSEQVIAKTIARHAERFLPTTSEPKSGKD